MDFQFIGNFIWTFSLLGDMATNPIGGRPFDWTFLTLILCFSFGGLPWDACVSQLLLDDILIFQCHQVLSTSMKPGHQDSSCDAAFLDLNGILFISITRI